VTPDFWAYQLAAQSSGEALDAEDAIRSALSRDAELRAARLLSLERDPAFCE
jgi:hypothetical protein